MREIRFRAWSDEVGELIPWEIILDDGFLEYYSNPDTLLEQYTGLKDENGKEIYEGDVVRYIDNSCACDLPGIYIVSGDVCVFPKLLLDCEVIGNIHENPELIK